MPPEVSSMRVRIGRRRFVTSVSPIPGMIRPIATRLCSIDMNSLRSASLNAQLSTTCCPFVLTTRAFCPRRRCSAFPRRAGISIIFASLNWLAAGWGFDHRAAIAAAGHQAILEIGVLAQRVDEKIRRDNQREHEQKPDQRWTATVGLIVIVLRLAHPRAPARG